MERLGGLIHRMPVTSLAFLVGCVAISALPPLNGFVSEWLTFQAILLSPQLAAMGPEAPRPGDRRAAGAAAALAAACFVRAFGIVVPRPAAQRRPRRRRARSTAGRSPPWHPRRCCACSPAFCPASVIDALAPVVEGLVARPHAGAGSASPGSRSSRSPRAAAPTTASSSSSSSPRRPRSRRSRSTAWRRARCGARRPGIAAFPMPARDAVHRRQLRPADPPRLRHVSCSARAKRSTCPRPATCARRSSRSRLHDLAWELHLSRRSPRPSNDVGRPAQPAAVPDDPPLSEPRLLRAGVAAAGARAMAADPRPSPSRARRCSWCCCWRRC